MKNAQNPRLSPKLMILAFQSSRAHGMRYKEIPNRLITKRVQLVWLYLSHQLEAAMSKSNSTWLIRTKSHNTYKLITTTVMKANALMSSLKNLLLTTCLIQTTRTMQSSTPQSKQARTAICSCGSLPEPTTTKPNHNSIGLRLTRSIKKTGSKRLLKVKRACTPLLELSL